MKPTSNQLPHKYNYTRRLFRKIVSNAPVHGLFPLPGRPIGISIIIRVKNEADWVEASIRSILSIADEVVVADNGSTDGTYDQLKNLEAQNKGIIKLWARPKLNICDISNFLLDKTSYRWIFRWDGDMIAHTSGKYNIASLRDRILCLDQRKYYLIYLRHINLAGDLAHQDPDEMVHIEEYIHTYSHKARFIHPKRFEAIKFPKYYYPLFWYEPYSFHVNVKPIERMLFRFFWEDWMILKNNTLHLAQFPSLEDYAIDNIEKCFGTKSWKEAQGIYAQNEFSKYIPYRTDIFGPYPDLLKPFFKEPKYELQYKNGQIVGRKEMLVV